MVDDQCHVPSKRPPSNLDLRPVPRQVRDLLGRTPMNATNGCEENLLPMEQQLESSQLIGEERMSE